MDINISGRKINVGEALTNHAKNRLQSVAEKYFARALAGSATFTNEGFACKCDVSLHPNQGINLHASAEAGDPYGAFDSAAEKIEKQLRRYKRRLKNHHTTDNGRLEIAPYTVFSAQKDESSDDKDNTSPGADIEDLQGEDGSNTQPGSEGAEDHTPIIIAESHKRIPRVSVGDAVMLMDLESAGAFMFRNTISERLEVIYRRSDGNIGWILPESVSETTRETQPHQSPPKAAE